MPSVTVGRAVTTAEAIESLRRQLGDRYHVEAKERPDAISVKLSALTFANVHRVEDGGSTTFRVHGGGLIIGRAINELGIARKVAAALQADLNSSA